MNPAFELLLKLLTKISWPVYLMTFGGFVLWPVFIVFFKSKKKKSRWLMIIFFLQTFGYAAIVSSLVHGAQAKFTDWGDIAMLFPFIGVLSIAASLVVMLLPIHESVVNKPPSSTVID